METFDFISHLNRQREFSLKTFGPGLRTKGVVDHIQKELKEILLNPNDLEEWIDVILLACDGAWRLGYSSESIVETLQAKLTKNINRIWPDWKTQPLDSAIEHIKKG